MNRTDRGIDRFRLTAVFIIYLASSCIAYPSFAGQAQQPAIKQPDLRLGANAGQSVSAAVTPKAKSEQEWPLVGDGNQPLHPSSVIEGAGDLYFVDASALWRVAGGARLLSSPQVLKAQRLGPPASVGKIPVQELASAVYLPGRRSLVVLDKSGDLLEYVPQSSKWQVYRANTPVGSPDPEYIDIAPVGTRVVALDPERNEIWRLPQPPGGRSSYFQEIMPWRLKPGDPSVADGLCIVYDGDTYVLKRSGRITRYGGGDGLATPKPFAWKPPVKMRPSRLATAPGTPLYIVERENNRVIALDRTNGRVLQFHFKQGSDLRGLLPAAGGFWVIDGSRLVERKLNQSDSWKIAPETRRIDSRLDGIAYPLTGVALPRHPGVWPGARRLYRYGVHQGVDFFCDAATTGRVVMGTTVRAADAGKVVRADVNFRDMDSATYARVMQQCRAEHSTSERNEDLLRGCQVWIDHGNGLMTKYAHLNSVKKNLKVGSYVARGDVIGYVGVSGTGQNLPGAVKHPHLHFEIWLDGHYLGWGLTQAETLGTFEDIFGLIGERGGS